MNKVRCHDCGLVEDENDENQPAFHQVPYQDVTPTDRGDWVREGYEWICDDCHKERGIR